MGDDETTQEFTVEEVVLHEAACEAYYIDGYYPLDIMEQLAAVAGRRNSEEK